MEGEDQRPIVIDNGSYMIKAGYGGDDHPCSVFRNIIASPWPRGGAGDQQVFYVGDEALLK